MILTLLRRRLLDVISRDWRLGALFRHQRETHQADWTNEPLAGLSGSEQQLFNLEICTLIGRSASKLANTICFWTSLETKHRLMIVYLSVSFKPFHSLKFVDCSSFYLQGSSDGACWPESNLRECMLTQATGRPCKNERLAASPRIRITPNSTTANVPREIKNPKQKATWNLPIFINIQHWYLLF